MMDHLVMLKNLIDGFMMIYKIYLVELYQLVVIVIHQKVELNGISTTKILRISHNFGRVLLDDTEQQKMIVEKEKMFTSDKGNLCIFDPILECIEEVFVIKELELDFTNINEMILSDSVLKKRVFKQQILDLHLKDFMIGQTTPYLNRFKKYIRYRCGNWYVCKSLRIKHSKSVICFEAVQPVYEQLVKIKKNITM